MLEPGHFFGEQCLTGQTVRTTTATVLEDATVLRIAEETMRRVLRDEPAFSALFLKYVLSQSMRVEETWSISSLIRAKSVSRWVLLLLANFGKKGRPHSTIPYVTQDMLAEMIGTTRPRVNFFMNKFRKLGFVEYNGTLRVHNSLLNIILHD
jgi:CRP/FNR family transcriptional regulator, cyclic AMP receptor protein